MVSSEKTAKEIMHALMSLNMAALSLRSIPVSAAAGSCISACPCRRRNYAIARAAGARLIEKLLEKAFSPLVMVVVIVMPASMALVIISRILRGLRLDRRHLGSGALDDFIELAPIQPHAPAFRAVVDLNALALGQLQGDVA